MNGNSLYSVALGWVGKNSPRASPYHERLNRVSWRSAHLTLIDHTGAVALVSMVDAEHQIAHQELCLYSSAAYHGSI